MTASVVTDRSLLDESMQMQTQHARAVNLAESVREAVKFEALAFMWAHTIDLLDGFIKTPQSLANLRQQIPLLVWATSVLCDAMLDADTLNEPTTTLPTFMRMPRREILSLVRDMRAAVISQQYKQLRRRCADLLNAPGVS